MGAKRQRNMRLDDGLWGSVAESAARVGVSVTRWVEEALAEKLARDAGEREVAEVPVPLAVPADVPDGKPVHMRVVSSFEARRQRLGGVVGSSGS